MGNRLKKVFNNSEANNYLSISFDNNSDAEKFADMLQKLWETGETQTLQGSASVTTSIGDEMHRFMKNEPYKMHDIQVSTSRKDGSRFVETKYGMQQFLYKYYFIKDQIVIYTEENNPVIVEMRYNIKTQEGKLRFRMQPGNGDSMENVVLYFSMIQKVVEDFFSPENMKDVPEQWEKTRMLIKEDLQLYELFWKIEQQLGIHFDTKIMETLSEEAWKTSICDAFEFYYAIICRYPLRLKVKLTATENTAMYLEEGKELKIGSEITLTYVGALCFQILEHTIKVYTADMLCNAVIKKIEQKKDGKIKIQYGERDSSPMYVSYTAYETEMEAAAEVKNIMNHENDYREAKSWDDYLNREEEWLFHSGVN